MLKYNSIFYIKIKRKKNFKKPLICNNKCGDERRGGVSTLCKVSPEPINLIGTVPKLCISKKNLFE